MAAKIEIEIGADLTDLFAKIKEANERIKQLGDQEATQKLASAFNNALKPIAQLESEIALLGKAIEESTDPADIKRLGDQVVKLNTQINNIKVVSLGTELNNLSGAGTRAFTQLGSQVEGLQKKSYTARFAVQNLGNTIRDIPFAAQNPAILSTVLDHLVDSFANLKQEAGSTKGAFALLQQTLSSGGGLLIGFNLLSLAATYLIPKLFETSEATKESAKAAKEAKEAYSAIIAPIAEEATKVAVLVEGFQKENITRKEKKNIIEQLQQISPAYFSNLDKEKTTIDQLQKSYDAYSKSLIRSIELKVREGQLTKVIERTLELQDKGNKITNQTVDANGKLQKSYTGIYDPNATGQAKFNQGLALTQDEQQELNNLLKTQKTLASEIGTLQQPQDFIKPDSAKKAKETIRDIIDDLDRELQLTDVIGSIFGKSTLEVTNQKVSAVTSTVEKLAKDFHIQQGDTIIEKLLGNENNDLFKSGSFFNNLKDLDLKTKLAEAIQKSVSPSPIKIIVPILPKIKLGEIKKKIILDGDELNRAFEQIGENAANAFGEGLGNIATGAGGIGDLFNGVFKEVGAGLKQLGQYFIKTALEVAVFKKIIIANPYLALAAGVALVALGQIIQNTTNKQKAFATGGRVPGFGSTDSVNAILTPGEFILKKTAAAALGPDNLSILNNGVLPQPGRVNAGELQVQLIGEQTLSGENIYISYNRTAARRGRQT